MKYKKIVVLDSVIFYPEHRAVLSKLADEVVEYPASIPVALEKQYASSPEVFKNKKCYTQIATDDVPKQLLADRIDGADVVVSCWTDIPDEVLACNPQLKLIVFWTHEKEHRINMELADRMGIVVSNIPDYGTDSVAEVVFAGLEELALRHCGDTGLDSATAQAHAVLADVFRYYRKLDKNEKLTRAGKFLHHFHKLGQVTWDFSNRDLQAVIPERLIEHKRVGLLNIVHAHLVTDMLSAFQVHVEKCVIESDTQTRNADFYKFMSDNEVVFFDSQTLDSHTIAKCTCLFGDRVRDIRTLPTSSYTFANKRFGIVGLGRIGKRVAGIAARLGFEVVYFSNERDQDHEQTLTCRYMDLPDLMRTSDVVSIHVPAHKAEGLIDEGLVVSMKHNALLINTADGNAIDHHALTQRLSEGTLLAYLDVYPGLPRKDIVGLPMSDAHDWKIRDALPSAIIAYRAGWKTQESIRIKTYKLLGELADGLIALRSNVTP